jgi:hypothetical protein
VDGNKGTILMRVRWDAAKNSDESAHRNLTAKGSVKTNNAPVCTIIVNQSVIVNVNHAIIVMQPYVIETPDIEKKKVVVTEGMSTHFN